MSNLKNFMFKRILLEVTPPSLLLMVYYCLESCTLIKTPHISALFENIYFFTNPILKLVEITEAVKCTSNAVVQVLKATPQGRLHYLFSPNTFGKNKPFMCCRLCEIFLSYIL